MSVKFIGSNGIKNNSRGVAAIEFALVLPLLILLVVSVVEISRFIITHQRIDKVSAQMADILSQTPQPKTVDANGAALRGTFEQLLGYAPEAGDGFVFSVIERGNNTPDATITYQSAMNGTDSDLGAKGDVVSSDRLGGVNPREGDAIIVVETRVAHQNLFGDLLSTLDFGGIGTTNFDGEQLYKPSFYVYRFNLQLNAVNASEQALGPIPAVCGYYRGAEDNRPDFNQNKIWDERDYNIWPLANADVPHPCTCYVDKDNKDNTRDELKDRLRTCVPELLVGDYNCPKRFTCCDEASPKTKLCNGCYDSNDDYVDATDPDAEICAPPPCEGCECDDSCPPCEGEDCGGGGGGETPEPTGSPGGS